MPHEQDYFGFRHLAAHRRTGLFLDLGANRGHSSRGFAKLVPGWDVLSVEANPLHEAQLNRLSQKNDRIRYRMAAVDDTTGRKCTLYVPFFHRIALHSAAAVTLAEARSVIEQSFPRQAPMVRYVEFKATTIAVDDLGVDPQIIKLDIQGNELAALRGAARTLTTSSPDLLVEITVAEVSLIDYLKPFGYRPYIYKHSTGTFALYVECGTSPSRNVFFSKRNLVNTMRT